MAKKDRLVIIDLSVSYIYGYYIPSNWDTEKIEDFMYSKGHKPSQCSWAIVNSFNVIVCDEEIM